MSLESAISTLVFIAAVYAMVHYPHRSDETAKYIKIKALGDLFEVLHKGADESTVSGYLKEEGACYIEGNKKLGKCLETKEKIIEYIYYDSKERRIKKSKMVFN